MVGVTLKKCNYVYDQLSCGWTRQVVLNVAKNKLKWLTSHGLSGTDDMVSRRWGIGGTVLDEEGVQPVGLSDSGDWVLIVLAEVGIMPEGAMDVGILTVSGGGE